ncbi:MAG: glycosyltransferase family 2 protein [Candidatus Muiribacteriaceae bacterium]
MKISLIIPTYKRESLFRSCLLSLKRQSFRDFEAIIVDDSPGDEIEQVLKNTDLNIPVRYFRNKGTGQAAARNLGVAKSSGEIVLFVDSDVILTEKALENHVRAHERSDIVIGRVEFPPGVRINRYNLYTDVAFYFRGLERGFTDFIKFLTCNLSIKRSLFESSGGFSEDFSTYGFEDLELGYRLCGKEKKIYFEPEALAYHYNNRRLSCIMERASDVAKASMIFYRKHPEYYNRWLLPVQRCHNIFAGKVPEIRPSNFRYVLSVIEENTCLGLLKNEVSESDLRALRSFTGKNSLILNPCAEYEIAWLAQERDVIIPVNRYSRLNRFIMEYKLACTGFGKIRYSTGGTKNSVRFYSPGIIKDSGFECEILSFFRILRNRFNTHFFIKRSFGYIMRVLKSCINT